MMGITWDELKKEIHAKLCQDGRPMGTHQKEHYIEELESIQSFKGQKGFDEHERFLREAIEELEQEGY